MPARRKCDHCHKKPATIHLTDLVHNKEVHLCPDCYNEQENKTNTEEVLNDFLDNLEVEKKKGTYKMCATCGITYEEFLKTGRLGCSDDYTTFASEIKPLLMKIHGAINHLGKVPSENAKTVSNRKKIRVLQQALKQAVARENYIEAARLRDEINTLKEMDDVADRTD